MSNPQPPWLAAARRGEAAAFRQLIDEHGRGLYAVCQRVLGDKTAAEDAVQDALLNAWKALDQYDGRASFAGWLHRIAVNAALAIARTRVHVQSRSALPLSEIETSMPDSAAAPMDWLDINQSKARLGRALGALSALERSAFVLRHVEQHALIEIAAKLQSNVNAIKQAVFRAVRKLRLALDPQAGSEGTNFNNLDDQEARA